jgi:hypothetical protein
MAYMGPGRKTPKVRDKSKKGAIGFRITPELHEKLIAYCESKNISITGFLRDHIKETLSNYEAQLIMEKDLLKERFCNPIR